MSVSFEEIVKGLRGLDHAELVQVADIARTLAKKAARREFLVGTPVEVDFNSKGIHRGIVIKVNPKTIGVVLTGPEESLPRNSRTWRVGATLLTKVDGTDGEAIKAEAEELKRKSSWLFD